MTREVDKIVANLLIAEGAVFLPGTGSLRVVRRAAQRLSARKTVPPVREVEFSSQTEGAPSLVDAVVRAAGCSEAQAVEICRRWTEQVTEGEALVIGGVGVLRGKSFEPEAVFDRLLNPHGRGPVAVRRGRCHWPLWTVAGAAALCGVGACIWILCDGSIDAPLRSVSDRSPVAALETQVPEPAMPGPAVGAERLATGTEDLRPSVSQPESPSVADDGALSPERLVSGHTYAVLGVYSTPENACRAAREAMHRDPELHCRVYRYGPKFMLSPCSSADAERVRTFVREHFAAYPELWTYRAK